MPWSRDVKSRERRGMIGVFNHNRIDGDTLWLFNIAMENGPFIDGLP